MRIDDLQERLLNGMIELYTKDYEGCLAGAYNSFPVWDGKGDRCSPKFLTDRTVYDINPTESYDTDLWPTADKFKGINFSEVFRKFCCV